MVFGDDLNKLFVDDERLKIFKLPLRHTLCLDTPYRLIGINSIFPVKGWNQFNCVVVINCRRQHADMGRDWWLFETVKFNFFSPTVFTFIFMTCYLKGSNTRRFFSSGSEWNSKLCKYGDANSSQTQSNEILISEWNHRCHHHTRASKLSTKIKLASWDVNRNLFFSPSSSCPFVSLCIQP